jgi:flagellar biogenesis protein FliO
VLAAQSFEKVPALHTLAPTQKEPPFAVAQLLVLVLFIVVTVFAVKRFRPDVMDQDSKSTLGEQKRAA